MTALVTMSRRELDRAGVLARLAEGGLTQVRAAELLGLSVRQVRRLSEMRLAGVSTIEAGNEFLPGLER